MSGGRNVVGHDELKRFIGDVLAAKGASAADAATVAEGLVWANLRGGDGHGVSRLPRYLKLIERGEIDPKAQPRLIHDPRPRRDVRARCRPRLWAGGGDAGRRDRRRAGKNGRRLFRSHSRDDAYRRHRPLRAVDGRARLRGNHHGRRAGNDGLSRRAGRQPGDEPDRHRGAERKRADRARHGDEHDLERHDFAGARDRRKVAKKHGVDRGRQPTTDPRKAEILLPLGGPKGSGLGLMFEMLASVLAAAPIQARALGPEKRTRHTQNTAILALDIATFRPLADFTHDADTLAAIIKALPRQMGFDEITLPGERSHRTEASRRKSGIPIPAKLWEELEGIAKAHAIKMPALLSAPAK